jgi:cell division protein FtsW (lipid II flippase)
MTNKKRSDRSVSASEPLISMEPEFREQIGYILAGIAMLFLLLNLPLAGRGHEELLFGGFAVFFLLSIVVFLLPDHRQSEESKR